MKRQEYLQALAPAMSAWRGALRRSTLITAPLNVGFVAWIFHLLKARDPSLESKVSLGFLLVIAAMVGTMAYMSAAFTRNSPTCLKCGEHVRFLQRRRVWVSRKCPYCHAEMLEA